MFKRIFPLTMIMALATFIGCSKEKEATLITPEQISYVGAAACQTCHASIYIDFIETGHAHQLKRAVMGAYPSYPDTVPELPEPAVGYSWDDISYIIGGYARKANFIDINGYVVTGNMVQWNLETEEWVEYSTIDDPGTKPYDCAGCHTTGYVESQTEHQGNMPGVVGTWAEDGVNCERCHGSGGQHVYNPADNRMTVDLSSAVCGECHSRTADNSIAALNRLIRNNGQYDELLGAGHANIPCVYCHDPHKSTVYDTGNAIKTACADCHSITVSHPGPDDCVLCHMPESVKSAVSTGSGVYLKGDMRSHIFAINPDTTEGQFYYDGADMYSNGFNGLNFACLSSCHSNRDLEWAADRAGSIHP